MEKFSLLSDNSQFSSASAVYNVGGLCRTIVPVLGETDAHQFLVGTANVRKPNEVHLVEYDDADNVITCKTVIQHAAGEIVGLFPNPVRRELFFVVYTDASSFVREGALLSLNQQAEPASREGADGRQGDGKTVVCPPAFQLPAIEGFGDLVCVVWKPAVEIDDSFAVDEIGADGAEDDEGELTFGGRVAGGAAVDTEGEHTFVSVYTNGFQVWDIMVDDHEGTQLQPRENARAVMWGSSPEDGNVGTVTAAAWDPHHKDLIVLAVGGDLVTFNVETLAEVRCFALNLILTQLELACCRYLLHPPHEHCTDVLCIDGTLLMNRFAAAPELTMLGLLQSISTQTSRGLCFPLTAVAVFGSGTYAKQVSPVWLRLLMAPPKTHRQPTAMVTAKA